MKQDENRKSLLVVVLVCAVLGWRIDFAGAWPVPDTGTPQPNTTVVGDDADYTINPQSFTDNGNGTVADNVTGLQWQQQDDNQTRTWDGATVYCDGLTLAGLTDWRLPTVLEISTIVDRGKYNPPVSSSIFPGTNANDYWTSEVYTASGYSGYALAVGFFNGGVGANIKSGGYYTRCVRGNQTKTSFVLNNGYMATDTTHGLAWQRNAWFVQSWSSAIKDCEDSTLGGYSDWRLPTITELLTIADASHYNPAVDSIVFPYISGGYWSSTTDASSTSSSPYAWYVDFQNGHSGRNPQTTNYSARCVRSGPTSNAATAVAIITPAQGATVTVGGLAPITWDSKNLGGQVTIELSRQGGLDGTWETIGATDNSFGSYDWQVSGASSVNCVLRVTPAADPSKAAYLGLFSIVTDPPTIPPPVTTPTPPPGLVWGQPMPDTNQNTSYTDTAGEDADYRTRRSLSDNGDDGTVSDNVTKLQWQREDDDQTRTWDQAKGYCDNLTLGGYSDWRLPTVLELASITGRYRWNPSIPYNTFPGTNESPYWSAEAYTGSTDFFSVAFDYGGVAHNQKTSTVYARCVRGNQTKASFVLNNGQVATDIIHGLAWQRTDDGYGKTWTAALTYCETLTLAGYSDWRLPNINELLTIADFSHYNPAVDSIVFPATWLGGYWSSTADASSSSSAPSAWYVDFQGGIASRYSQTTTYVPRCVRSGPMSNASTAVAITSPDQGSTAIVGATTSILWDTRSLDGQVTIELSRQGGLDGTWETLATTDNTGSYNWTVTVPESVNCVLKVTPAADPTKTAYQGLFSIATMKLALTTTLVTSFTKYTLDLKEQLSNGLVHTVDPATVTWQLSDTSVADIQANTLTAKKNGVVKVSAEDQGQTASATLFLVTPGQGDEYEGINNSAATAESLAQDFFIQGQIEQGLTDWYEIALTESDLIAVDFTSTSQTADVAIDLLNLDGQILASTTSTNGGHKTMRGGGLAPGFYRLRLSQAQGGDLDQNASYTLAWHRLLVASADLEPNNTAALAKPLPKGLVNSGLLPSGDTDYYTLSLAQPTLVRLALATASNSADYVVQVYKKGDETKPVDSVTIINGVSATWDQGLAKGEYLIKVTGLDYTTTTYTLSWQDSSDTGMEVEPNDTLTTVNGIDLATERSGRVTTTDDQDLYGFTLGAQTAITATMKPTSATATYTFDLINAAGTLLSTKSVNLTNTSIQKSLPKGIYYLRVKSNGVLDPLASYGLALSSATSGAQVTTLTKLADIKVGGASTTVAVGGDMPLTVTAYYSDASSGVLGSGLAFTSSDPTVLTVDSSGLVSAIKEGHATVTASYQGKAASLPLTVGTPQAPAKQSYGNLIIVAGGSLSSSDSLKDATLHLSEMAYQKFQARNFEDEDIYFMSQTVFHDLNGDGYDDQIVDENTPTTGEVVAAVTDWAKAQSSSGPLYLYLMDHGAKQQFQVAPGQILSATQLKAALDSFQKDTGRPAVVIIEACYSGSFVEPLQNSAYERLVLTSVDGLNPAYLSPDGTTSYSAFMLANLYKGKSISDSLSLVKSDLTTIGMPYKKMAPQVAGKESLKSLKVGGDFALAGIFPELKNNTQSQTITAGSTLNLTTEATSMLGGLSVWTVIIPPDYTPPEVSGDFVSVVDELPKVTLVDEDPTTKMMDGVYVGSYADFKYNGDYTVIFYAKDSENNLVKSAPVTLSVSGGIDLTTTTTSSTTTTEPSTTTTSTTAAPTSTTTEAPTTTTSTSSPSTSTTTTILGSESFTLPVSAGWSLLSSTIGFQATAVFGDTQKFTSVWKWTDGDTGTKTWAVYLPGGDDGVSYAQSKGFKPLSSISSGEGFWVNGKAGEQVKVSGTPVYGELSFAKGWNLVGVKATKAMSVADLGPVTSVWKWTTVNGTKTWAVNLPGEGDNGGSFAASKGFGQFTTIEPGEGFWVNNP